MTEQGPIDWEHVARASVHPLRIAVLECLAAEERPLSPRELAARVGQPLGNVAYHVRQLDSIGLIELAHTAPRRSAIEHSYRLAPARTRKLGFHNSVVCRSAPTGLGPVVS